MRPVLGLLFSLFLVACQAQPQSQFWVYAPGTGFWRFEDFPGVYQADKPFYIFVPLAPQQGELEVEWQVPELNYKLKRRHKLRPLSSLRNLPTKELPKQGLNGLMAGWSWFNFFPDTLALGQETNRDWLLFCDTLLNYSRGQSRHLACRWEQGQAKAQFVFIRTNEHPYQGLAQALERAETLKAELAQVLDGLGELRERLQRFEEDFSRHTPLQTYMEQMQQRKQNLFTIKGPIGEQVRNFLAADEQLEVLISQKADAQRIQQAEESRQAYRQTLELNLSARNYLRQADELIQLRALKRHIFQERLDKDKGKANLREELQEKELKIRDLEAEQQALNRRLGL